MASQVLPREGEYVTLEGEAYRVSGVIHDIRGFSHGSASHKITVHLNPIINREAYQFAQDGIDEGVSIPPEVIDATEVFKSRQDTAA